MSDTIAVLHSRIQGYKDRIIHLRSELEKAGAEKAERLAKLELAHIRAQPSAIKLAKKIELPPAPDVGQWPESVQKLHTVFRKFAEEIITLEHRLAAANEEIAEMGYMLAHIDLVDAFQRNLMALFRQPNAKLLDEIEGNLTDLLKGKIACNDPRQIYSQALFLANFDKARFNFGTDLYEVLRRWMILRGCDGSQLLPGEKELQYSLLLTIAQSDNRIGKDLTEPLEKIVALRDVAVNAMGSGNPLQWVRDHLINKDEPLTSPEQKFLDILYERLSEKKGVPPLTWKGEGKEFYLMALEEQLAINPQFSVSLVNTRAGNVALNGEEWRQHQLAREAMIEQTIIACIDLKNLSQEMLALRSKEEVPSEAHEVDRSTSEKLETRFKEGVIVGEKEALLNEIEGDIVSRFEKLSGLQIPHDCRKEFVKVLFERWCEGRLPLALKRLLSQGDGNDGYEVAKLLYYRSALLGYRNPKFPPASLSEWEWMIPSTLPSHEKARRLSILVQQFHKDDYLNGSALTKNQVLWAEALYYNLVKGANLQINEEPGAGKTVSVAFALKLLQIIFPECRKEMDWISPFANLIHGLNLHMLLPGDDLSSLKRDNFAGAADEAHKLKPGLAVSPVHITATPIRPDLKDMELRQKELDNLKKSHEKLSNLLLEKRRDLSQREASNKTELSKIKSEINTKANKELIKNNKERLPGPRRGRVDKYFDSENIAVHDILSCIYWIGRNESANTLINDLTTAQQQNQDLIEFWSKRSKKNIPAGLQTLEKLCLRYLRVEAGRFDDPEDRIPRDEENQKQIASLKSQIKTLQAHEQELREKIGTMSSKIARYQKPAYLKKLPERQEHCFANIDYQSHERRDFSPESAVNMVETAFAHQPPGKIVQLIFPGVRFEEASFDDLILSLSAVMPQKPVRFIYHNSHSKDGEFGQNWVVEVTPDGTLVRSTLKSFIKNKRWEEAGQIAIFYDWTDVQGGDRGVISRAHHDDHGLPISTYIFSNLGERGHDPIDEMSGYDVFQAVSRRRLTPGKENDVPRAVVFASPATSEIFKETTMAHQQQLKKLWAIDEVAKRAAKKIFKAYKMKRGEKAIRGRRLEEVVPNHQAVIKSLEEAILTLTPADTVNRETLRLALREKVSFHEVIDDVFGQESPDDDRKEGDFRDEEFAAWRVRKAVRGALHLIQQAVNVNNL